MFHKKNIIKILALLSFSALLIIAYLKKDSGQSMEQMTYQIKNKKLESHLTTKKEEKKYNLVSDKKDQQLQKTKRPISKKDFPLKEKKWKDNLAKELLRFQKPDTKVFIKSIKKNYRPGQEVVIISYRTMSNSTSFTASVNTQTGKIIETWGRTIIESDKNEVTFRL